MPVSKKTTFLQYKKSKQSVSAPHIGHLYSAVIADAIVRFERLLNRHSTSDGHYFLTTGTDEHGSKIQQAAQHHNTTPRLYCDRIADDYRQLFGHAHIGYTDFIRTSEQRHRDAVTTFWVRFIYKRIKREYL